MRTTFKFHLFKPFAEQLLKEQLPELASAYYQLLYEAQLPILQLFENLTEQQRLKQAQYSLQEALHRILDDTALDKEFEAIEKWYHNQANYKRENVQAADLVLIFSVRRRLFMQFLPSYTSDFTTGIRILEEYEEFSARIKKRAFEVYEQIQQEELNKEREQQEEILRGKNELLQHQKEELLTTVSELRSSNDELELARCQLQHFNTELEEHVKERTHELEYQRQWLYSLFMQVPGLIGILSGEEGTVVLFNQAFSNLWGGRQVLGQPMRQAWPELEGQGYFEHIEEVMKTGKAVERQEFPGLIDRNNDGQLHQGYFNFVYLPYLNPKGETEGVIIYGVDVTEQVEARKRVEHSEEQLRLALEAGQMGIWDYNPINDTSFHSPLFNKIFGYTVKPDGWNYERFMGHVVPECRESVAEKYLIALKTGKLLFDTKIKAADGVYRWILLRGKVFYDDQNKPVRIAGAVLDISDRKRSEEELRQSHQELKRINTDLDNFIYTASHDLRSPIINLESLVALLLRRQYNACAEEDQKVLEMMSTSIGRLKRTIDALTDITRIQKEDELQERVSFADVLKEVEADIAPELAESATELKVNFQVPCVQFVPHNLRSILYNLLSNAIKYRKPDAHLTICISTYQEDAFTVLSVQDNGLGISESNQKKLFSMFKRFHTHVKGSGIGLYLIKRIIENAGGRIEAESEEGIGSTFRVYFPAATAQP